MKNILHYLEQDTVLGHNPMVWAIFLAAAGVSFVVLYFLKTVITWRLKKIPQKRYLNWLKHTLHTFENTKVISLIAVSFWIGGLFADLPAHIEQDISQITAFILFLQVGFWIDTIYRDWYTYYYNRQMKTSPATVTTLGALRVVISAIIWICIFLLALDNAGVNIRTLVTGLGIGGIAIALAVQNTLGDLMASLSIVLDKPFIVGDFLIVDAHMGAVEHIGLKTTRLRSISGEELVFSNTNLLQSRIHNYGRMYQRRVVGSIGVTYQTPPDLLEAIPPIIRAAIESQKQTRFDRAHFKNFGGSSLDFEYVYFVTVADYNAYMDIQQAINLILLRKFNELKIDFAYPTQTLFIEKPGSKDANDNAVGKTESSLAPATSSSPAA